MLVLNCILQIFPLKTMLQWISLVCVHVCEIMHMCVLKVNMLYQGKNTLMCKKYEDNFATEIVQLTIAYETFFHMFLMQFVNKFILLTNCFILFCIDPCQSEQRKIISGSFTSIF